VVGLLLIIVAMTVAPWITKYSPVKQDIRNSFLPPSASHLLGTDRLGRDVFTRIIYGARVSLRVGLLAVALGCVIGIPLGLISGYYGGWFDSLAMRLVDILLAFPGMLLALGITAILGPSLKNAIIATSVYLIPDYVRVTRSSTLSNKEMDYLMSSRAIGCSSWYTMLRYILPNVAPPLIVLLSFDAAVAILFISGLSFLGMGAQPPTAEWGLMLANARLYLRQAWWPSTFSGLALMFTVLMINMVGEGLRNVLDPRSSIKSA